MDSSVLSTREFVSKPDVTTKAKALVALARPFTLIAPVLGMLSGGLVAWFSMADRLVTAPVFLLNLLLGALAAALLNSASNAINQVYDADIDRINKPSRPIPTGKIGNVEALVFAGVTGVLALVIAGVVSWLTGQIDTLLMFALAGGFSVAYSVPPVRMKSRGWWANVTVALPRGVFLKVAGWSLAASMVSIEAWYIGGIMGLFLLGATTTKDFADIRGDGAYGVRTLPVEFGAVKAARQIAAFLVLPFLLIPLGSDWVLGVLEPLSGDSVGLLFLGGISTLWGTYVALLVLTDAEALTNTENHPAWRHMYYLMMFLQVGFVLAYLPAHWWVELFR